MQSDDVGLLAGESAQSAIAEGDVPMGGSMKSVSPDAVPPIEMIGNGIEVGLLRKGMMERSIEYRHLGNVFAQEFAGCLNTLDVIRIMKRREIDAILDPFQHPIVNQGGFLEQLPAMHHAVPHRIQIGRAPDFRHS